MRSVHYKFSFLLVLLCTMVIASIGCTIQKETPDLNAILNNSTALSSQVPKDIRGIDQLKNTIISDLEFNEYKIIEIDNRRELVKNEIGVFYHFFDQTTPILEKKSLNDFKQKYPVFKIQNNIGEYQLNIIKVIDKSVEDIQGKDINNTYQMESKIENIDLIRFIYSNTDINLLPSNNIAISFSPRSITKSKSTDSPEVDKILDMEQSNLSGKSINIDNREYHLLLKKNTDQLSGIYTEINSKDRIVHVFITAPLAQGWQFNTEAEIKQLFNETALSDFIHYTIESLIL